MRARPMVVLAVAIVLASVGATSTDSRAVRRSASGRLPAAAVANDNRTPAGTMEGDTLVLRLVAQEARWYIHAEADGAFEVPAFAEEGRPPSIPGPLLRARLGTPIRVVVRNATGDTLVVRGLGSRADAREDSLLVVPGETAEARFVADREGSFFYWAHRALARPNRTPVIAFDRQSQLTGAFVVDPADGAPAPDRIFVITEHIDTEGFRTVPDARGILVRDFVAFNGKSWPDTEPLTYALGDTIRWRIINASEAPHSLHLHGFYYRVTRIGGNTIDSVFHASDPRMAVTEQLAAGRTMSLEWVPDRPGGWIFHCHMTPHIARHPSITDRTQVDFPIHDHQGDPDDHLRTGMNGLLLATRVTGEAQASHASAPPRRMRVFVQSDSLPGDVTRRFGYVLQRAAAEPARDSLEAAPPVLLLTRGEPTVIEVVNRSGGHTAVHWHGIELESYFDGVIGFGGTPGRLTTAIAPGSSFDAHMTPPRAGTFMYHTHFDELRQQFGGLVGPLIVLEPGERWDPERDRVILIHDAQGVRGLALNGASAPRPLELTAGTTYRLRIANIAADRPLLTAYLMRDSTTYASWRPVAKDGWTLSGDRATERPSWQRVGTGETADFEFTPAEPGELVLELRGGSPLGVPNRALRLVIAQPVRVVARAR